MTTEAAWKCLPKCAWTLETRHLSFRLIVRQGAGVLLYLHAPHQETPFTLFDVLGMDAARTKEIASLRICKHCDFSNGHLKRHPSAELLGGHESVFVLAAVAEKAKVSSANVECGHSYWQREARLRSIQTHSEAFQDCSGTVIQMQARRCELNMDVVAKSKKRGRPFKPRRRRIKKDAPFGPTKKKHKTANVALCVLGISMWRT